MNSTKIRKRTKMDNKLTVLVRMVMVLGLVSALNAPAVRAQVTPTVTPTATPLSYVKVNDGQEVDPGLTITGTAITQVTGATVTITNPQPGDELIYTDGGNVNGSFSGNTLTLTSVGNVAKESFQTRLRTIKFKAGGGGNPSTAQRTISFSINISANSTNPVTLGLYGTGVNSAGNGVVNENDVDDHWQLKQPGTSSFGNVSAQRHTAWGVGGTPPQTVWADAVGAPWSRWIGNISAGESEQDYIFRQVVDFTNISITSLQGKWSADNEGTRILVNGVTVPGQTGSAFSVAPNTFTINPSFFISGENTLDFVVRNTAGQTDNPYGTRIEFTSVSATGSASATRTIDVAKVHAGNSAVAVSPASVIANGASYSTVTVTVKDAAGTVIPGLGSEAFTPQLMVAGTPSGTATFTDFTEVGAGVYTLRAKNTAAQSGAVRVTVKGVQITQQPALTFTVQVVNAGHSTVASSPASVTADGVTPSTVTVTVKDADNQPIPGATVTLEQNAGGYSQISAASGLSNASGVASFTVTNTKAETVTYTATADGTELNANQVTVTFTAGPATKFQVLMPGETAAPGTLIGKTGTPDIQTAGNGFTLTVNIVDANWNIVANADAGVKLATNDAKATLTDGTTLLPDLALFNVQDGTGTLNVIFKTAGTDRWISAADIINPGLGSSQGADTEVIHAGINAIERISGNGQTGVVATELDNPFVVKAVDVYGNPVPGVTVLFSVEGTPPSSNGHALDEASVVTDADGLATAKLTLGNKSGDYTVQADYIGNAPDGFIDFTATAIPGPADAGKSAIVADPATVTTDGSSTITVTIKDANGNLVEGETATLTQNSGASSTISAASGTSSAAGVITFTVKNTKAETVTYTATVSGTPETEITQTAAVTFTAGAPSAANSTVAASPSPVTADGSTEATITVTVKDANGNPVEGETLTLAQGAGSSTISAASGTSSAAGVVTFTVKSTKAETVTYTATISGTPETEITQTAAVIFTAGAPSAGESTVSAAPPVVTADGSTESTITVTVKDANENPVEGETVTLAQGAGSSTISAASGTSSAAGVVTFMVKSTKAETVTYTATVSGTPDVVVTQTADVTFTAGAPSAGESTVSAAPPSVTADGSTESTIMVTVKDANENPVEGETVTLAQNSDAASTISAASGTSSAAGVVTFTVKGTKAETVTYTATVSGTPETEITQTTAVTFTAGAASQLSITKGPSTSARSGIAFKQQPVIQLQDASGNAVSESGIVVTATVSSGGTLIGTATVATGASGMATFTDLGITGMVGDYTLTFSSPDLDQVTSGTVTLGAGDANASSSTVSAHPTSNVVADGDDESQITVTVVDAAGNPVMGALVYLEISNGAIGSGTMYPSGLWKTDTDGEIIITLTSTVANNVEVTAYLGPDTDGESIGKAPVGFIAGDASQLLITTQPSSSARSGIAFDQQPVIQLQDANGNAVSEPDIAITASVSSGGTPVGTVTADTDEDGVATFTDLGISGTVGDYTLTFSSTPLMGAISGTVTLGAGDADASTSTVIANPPAVTADGSTESTITVTVKDANGNPVEGETVTLAQNSGATSTISAASGLSNASGVVTFTVTNTKTETVTYTATMGSMPITETPITQTAEVTFTAGAPTAGNSTVTSSPPTVTADGDMESTITVTVKDANDNPVAGETVMLVQNSGATSTISLASGASSSTGEVTFTVTNTTAETVTYTATVGSTTIAQTADVIFTAGAAMAGKTTADVPAGTAGEETTVIITVLDEYDNPVTGVLGDLSLSVTGANADAMVSSVTDNGDGTYTVTYTPTKSGDDDIAITLGGTAINGSPYSSVVSPAVADASNTNADIPAGTAGEETTVIITVLDEYDNPVTGVSGDLSVSVTGANAGATVSSVTDNGDGTYTVTYTPSTSGTDNIAITLGGSAISGSPYSSDVVHNALAKIILASEETDLASGTTRELTVTLQDIYGNTVAFGPESSLTVSFVRLTGSGSVSGLGTVNAAVGVANLTITGEKPGDIFLLAAITTPALTSNQLSFTITVDKTNLQSAITEARGLMEADYSPASWSALESALTAAETVNGNADATQSEVDAAEQALRDAISGLSVDKTGLQSAIDEAGNLTETDYSPASWSVFEQALEEAETVYADPDATQSEVDAAEQALRDVISGLSVDKTGLQSAIDEAGNLTETDYSPASWSVFEQALEEAETVYAGPDATQLEVDAAEQALRDAVAGLSVDKSALDALVTDAGGLSEPDWSPASWSNLQDALATAQLVLDDTDATQSEVDAALSTLQAAIDNLSVDKTNLQSAIAEAGGLTASDYAPSSWSVLQQALEEAQAVYADPTATQSATDAAQQALREAMAGLLVDKSALQNAIDEGLELDKNNYTPASWADFEGALGEARTVLDDPAATQAAVDAARTLLDNARSKLTAGDTPTAPRNVVAIAGDREIDLAWTAPENSGGTPITDYIIQYTLDDGVTWTTVVDGIAAVTTAKITELTNNVPYRLRVAAINAAGTGAFSTLTLTVVPTIPVPDETGELPTLQPGEAIVIVDGEPKNVTLEVIDNSYLRLSGEGFAMDLTSIGVNGQLIPITDVEAVIRINHGQGAVVQVTGYGFEPGTVVTIYIFSLPQLLGHIPVQADGTFAGALAIPADLPLGRHTLQANGVVRSTGAERSVSVGILVVDELEQQINFAPMPDKTYGDKEITLQATATSGLPISYRITDMQGNHTNIATLVEGNRVRINGAGRVQIIASQSGAGNYGAAKDVVRTLVIQPATLSVSVQAVDRPYGEANPAFVLNYTGFVPNDTERVLEQAPVATTVATPSSNIGIYPITIAGGKSTDYVFEYTPSTLTVVRAHQQIEFNAPDQLERDAGRVPLNVSATSGLPVSLTIDDEQVARLDGETLEVLRVGTVTITATQEGNANYYPADPVTITIRVTDGSDFPVHVHKAVSPNGDGINEFLMLEGIKDFPENRVTIINKNGTVLFEISGYDNGTRVFRGVSTGQLQLPAGTYFYVVEIKENGVWRAQKGYFVMRY